MNKYNIKLMKFNIKPNLSKITNFNKITKLQFNNGDLINTCVFSLWTVHESYLMNNYNIGSNLIPETILHTLSLTWQYVGLFIISHDLHHNEEPTLYQNFLGRLSLFCYGGFLLEDFSKNHMLHHKYPGINGKDPDFSDRNPIIWYFNFMIKYINIKQIIIQICIYNISKLYDIPNENLIFFWLIPSLLGSLQLFYFGTYLVHEENGKIKNSDLPDWVITLTSYNFGHHENHHKYPKIPWYDLKRQIDM